jgi:hypothetical protein
LLPAVGEDSGAELDDETFDALEQLASHAEGGTRVAAGSRGRGPGALPGAGRLRGLGF